MKVSTEPVYIGLPQNDSLHIISDSRQWKVGPVSASCLVSVLDRDSAGAAIRTSQAVQAYDKKPRHVKRLAGATHQGTPPIAHVRTATQRMAYDQGIISVWGQSAPGGVGDGHIAECDPGFEGEGRDDDDRLIVDELREGVLRLRFDSLYGI
jgi:hypothetical protein